MKQTVSYHQAAEWLDELTDNTKKQLSLSDGELADLLLRRGLSFYLKSLTKQAMCEHKDSCPMITDKR